MTDRPYRPSYLDVRPPPPQPARRPASSDEYRPMLDKNEVGDELRLHIDRLRAERTANDERARRADLRQHEGEANYWRSRADGLGAGLAALRDALHTLTGEEY